MTYCSGSHTKFYHRFHVVWITKYRYKVLYGEMRKRLREIIRQTCAEMGVQITKGVLSSDQVHMFVSVPPQLALSRVSAFAPECRRSAARARHGRQPRDGQGLVEQIWPDVRR